MLDTPDTYEIKSRDAYHDAMTTLNKKSRPPAILRLIMNAFEAYRQARKIGWSRPWNKYGIKTFRSYKLKPTQDVEIIAYARELLDPHLDGMDASTRAFIEVLLHDNHEHRDALMGFVFYHEAIDGDAVREGVTLSLGRINEKKRHRDRIDLVFEADVNGGNVGPCARLKIYVDPFHGVAPPAWETTMLTEPGSPASRVFDHLRDLYGAWSDDPSRAWDHWTSQYIDFFGPRRHYAANSHFPLSDDEMSRRA